MTEENKKARKEAKQKSKKRRFFESIDTRKEYVISCIVAFILLLITSLFSSSALNTVIISFAFDFLFINYIYKPAKNSHAEQIRSAIKRYNEKHSDKTTKITFDEEQFERRKNYITNALKTFIYCAYIIPSFFYEGFAKNENVKCLSSKLMINIWNFFNYLFTSIGKEAFTIYSFAFGAIVFIFIIFISKETNALADIYQEKYNLFKDIKDSFGKEDFLYLNKTQSTPQNKKE